MKLYPKRASKARVKRFSHIVRTSCDRNAHDCPRRPRKRTSASELSPYLFLFFFLPSFTVKSGSVTGCSIKIYRPGEKTREREREGGKRKKNAFHRPDLAFPFYSRFLLSRDRRRAGLSNHAKNNESQRRYSVSQWFTVDTVLNQSRAWNINVSVIFKFSQRREKNDGIRLWSMAKARSFLLTRNKERRINFGKRSRDTLNIFYNYYYKRISVKMIKRNNSNSHSIHSRDILTTFQTSILIYAPSFVTFINACLNIIM